MEVWKDIAEADGYQVSNMGRVKSLRRNKPYVVKQMLYGDYWSVTLSIKGRHQMRSVHRLVALAFIPNPENKPQVNHINGVKTDNRVENLEWCTPRENAQHASKANLLPSGGKSWFAKLTDEQAVYIRSVYKPFSREFGIGALAVKFGVDQKTVHNIIRGKAFKFAGGTIHDRAVQRVPDDVREEIRRLYRKGVPGFGLPTLAKKFGLALKTVANIVRENPQ